MAGGSVRGEGGYAPDNRNKWISRWLLRREADAATDRAMNIDIAGVVMENASKMKQRDKRGGRKGVKREM